MAQLTSLYLSGTLRDIGGSWRCELVLATAGNVVMMLRVVGWRLCARLQRVVGFASGEPRGGLRAGNRIGDGGAASLAPSLERMAQLTSLNLGGTLRDIGGSCDASGCLRTPAMR